MNILGETMIERRRAHTRSYILAFVLSSPCFQFPRHLRPGTKLGISKSSKHPDKIDREEEVCGWVSWTILSAFLIERLHLSFLPPFQEAEFFLPFLPFADPTIVRNVFRRSEVEGNDQLPYRDTRARDLTTLTSRSKGARNIGGERREKERRETSGVPAE